MMLHLINRFVNYLSFDLLIILLTLSSLFLYCRWLLRINQEAYHCRRLGLGLVAGDRCAETLAECDDAESDVRERGDGTGCSANCYGCGSVQDHEGMWPGSGLPPVP